MRRRGASCGSDDMVWPYILSQIQPKKYDIRDLSLEALLTARQHQACVAFQVAMRQRSFIAVLSPSRG
jgi:hypothetical protein